MKPFCVLCVILLASSIVFADQVVLKNGDRLTGTIVKSDGKNLVLKSEFAGEVTIQWDAVQGLTSAGDLHLDLKNGQKIVGQVSTIDGRLVVATKAQGNVSAPVDSVAIIRNTNEQLAYDKSLHPGLREGWAAAEERHWSSPCVRGETRRRSRG